ncbi:MAG: pseudouridine synthase [Pseudomonadota bacterium]|nr:pseudouridine synthase [Pseudomonadota bacterium]
MTVLYLFNKPFRVMSQFTPCDDRETLANYIDIPAIYPAGRLDFDSEGLMVLTGDGSLQHRISHPDHKLSKCYWVEVEGEINESAINALQNGVELKDGLTQPALAHAMDEPAGLWPRQPPVRYRAAIPTSWLSLEITEGRNRQVRRMTAAVGFPTLRLIRASIGPWSLDDLAPGQSRIVELSTSEQRKLFPKAGRCSTRNAKTRKPRPRTSPARRGKRSPR